MGMTPSARYARWITNVAWSATRPYLDPFGSGFLPTALGSGFLPTALRHQHAGPLSSLVGRRWRDDQADRLSAYVPGPRPRGVPDRRVHRPDLKGGKR